MTTERSSASIGRWESQEAFVRSLPHRNKCSERGGDANGKFFRIPWNQVTDDLYIDVGSVSHLLKYGVHIKWKLLKGLSQIFDPLGILWPIPINFRTLTQNVARSSTGTTRSPGNLMRSSRFSTKQSTSWRLRKSCNSAARFSTPIQQRRKKNYKFSRTQAFCFTGASPT